MNILQRQITTSANGVDISDTPEGLAAIHAPGCAAAIWRRQTPHGFQDWIDALPADHLPATRTVLRPGVVGEAVQHMCAAAGMEDGPQRGWLVDDIAGLSARFADVMDAPCLRLRLGVITTNACRKFHIDSIRARLICTYRGTGTQYGVSHTGADPRRVFTLATGSPMVMRGTLWPETPASGLRHRSPPIEGTGETRLVLVLDPVLDLEDG